jgi:protein phosphatase
VVGAASVRPQRRPADEGSSAAERAAALTAGPALDPDADAHEPPPRGRAFVRLAGVAVIAFVLAGGAFAAWHWVRQQYFVGVYGQQVAVFRGLPQDLGPLDLATLDHTTGVLVDTLPPADRDSVRAGLVVDNGAEAAAKVEALREASCSGGAFASSPSATAGTAAPTGSGAAASPPAAAVTPTPSLPAQSAPVAPATGPSASVSPSVSPSGPAQPSPSGSAGAAVTCAGVR